MLDQADSLRRLLAVRLDNIGDVVMLTPALRALRHAFPAAGLTLMASPAGSQVAPMLPWVDDIMVYRPVWQDASWSMPLDAGRELALADDLRRREFDAAFIFTSFSQSPYPPAYACYLAGVPVRIGQSKEFGGSVLSTWVKPLPDAVHQVDRNLHLLSSVGISGAGEHMELAIPPAVQEQADALLAGHGIESEKPFLLLAPGASCEARRYDPVRFGVVAARLLESTELPLVVVGSARERPLFEPVLTAAPRRIADLVGRTSIPELAAVIRRARLVIANNSGPLHMADAFVRPMVLLYSGTEHESQWRPRFSPTELLRVPTDCSPCYSFKCPYNKECLDIDPMTVVDSALDLLARTERAADHAFAERL